MKIPDPIFWIVLVAIAVFYIIKGNDMHKERIPITKDKSVLIDK